MSWKNAVSYSKAIWEKGVNDGDDETTALPLGAKIGALVQLQKAPFIRAISQGSWIEMPTDSQAVIKAISRVQLNMQGSMYRYYLQKGDLQKGDLHNGDAKTKGKEIFLQVYVNEQGEVAEIVYCTGLTRLIPETQEDQDIFTGLAGYGLGDKTYSLWRFQMEELGYADVDIKTAFGSDETIDYQRDIGDPSQEFIRPFVGKEIRLDDALGNTGLEQEIYFMPYSREIEDIKEYLFISTEVVQSRNGDTNQRDIHVDFMVGIAVEPERLMIQ